KFSLYGRFDANPHYYDYLHYVDFKTFLTGEKTSGQLEMADGAGQRMNALIKGTFTLQPGDDEQSIKVLIDELVEWDWMEQVPIEDGEKFPSIIVTIRKEEGVFPFREQIVWNLENEDRHPCLLYRTRYLFDVDPLEMFSERREGNLYNMFEHE